ncbi:MAG: helix-turn-helix domain-containing protein [Vicingaceae bacterium]
MEKDKKAFIIKFGINLKQIRKAKKLTQAQLAADCNIEISQISRIERGVLNTSLGNVLSISKALNINMEELFKFKECDFSKKN